MPIEMAALAAMIDRILEVFGKTAEIELVDLLVHLPDDGLYPVVRSIASIAPCHFERAGVLIPHQDFGLVTAHGIGKGSLNGRGQGGLFAQKISNDLVIEADLPVGLVFENEIPQMGQAPHSSNRIAPRHLEGNRKGPNGSNQALASAFNRSKARSRPAGTLPGRDAGGNCSC